MRLALGVMHGAALLAGAAVLPGVTAFDALNATVPGEGIEVRRGVAYGSHPRQSLDIYRARGVAGAPVVVFFHGGSWRTGRAADYRFMGLALARMGFVGVVAGYRLFPEVRFPAFVDDAAAAIAAAQAGAAGWGGDPGRVVAMGHSAGAHVAAMAALDGRHGLAGRLAGLVGLAGPYDFLPMTDPEVIEVFGADAASPATQPVSFAGPGAPPALLLHGAEDRTVLPSNSLSLAARLRAAGASALTGVVPRMAHMGIVLAFTPLFARPAGVAADVAAFVQALPGVQAAA